MTKSKRTLLVTSILAMVLLFVVGSTLAYLTDKRSVINVMRIGEDSTETKGVNIKLDEPNFRTQIDAARATMATGSEDNAGKYTYNTTTGNTTDAELNNIMPGKSIQKDPTITNDGAGPVYIRFKLVDQTDTALTPAMLAKLMNANSHATDPGLGLAINTSFVLGSDGYYYYATGTTPTVFNTGSSVKLFVEDGSATTMKVPAAWDYTDISAFGTAFNIKVIAEAVQTDGVSGVPWLGNDTGAAITANAH